MFTRKQINLLALIFICFICVASSSLSNTCPSQQYFGSSPSNYYKLPESGQKEKVEKTVKSKSFISLKKKNVEKTTEIESMREDEMFAHLAFEEELQKFVAQNNDKQTETKPKTPQFQSNEQQFDQNNIEFLEVESRNFASNEEDDDEFENVDVKREEITSAFSQDKSESNFADSGFEEMEFSTTPVEEREVDSCDVEVTTLPNGEFEQLEEVDTNGIETYSVEDEDEIENKDDSSEIEVGSPEAADGEVVEEYIEQEEYNGVEEGEVNNEENKKQNHKNINISNDELDELITKENMEPNIMQDIHEEDEENWEEIVPGKDYEEENENVYDEPILAE